METKDGTNTKEHIRTPFQERYGRRGCHLEYFYLSLFMTTFSISKILVLRELTFEKHRTVHTYTNTHKHSYVYYVFITQRTFTTNMSLIERTSKNRGFVRELS